ncbi:MAG: lamin tail domain-containing protein [Myxococcales bacterium]|nr:lamin tail domain-containing protein [Myxococcales bacterium]
MLEKTAITAATLALLGCLAPPPGDPLEPPAPGNLELMATDFAGAPVSLERLPRWPRLWLSPAPASPDPPEPGVLLLQGAPDQALLDDLQGRPLRLATLARQLEVAIAETPWGLEVLPLEPLEPGAPLSLALPAWAVSDAHPAVWELRVDDAPAAGARVKETFPGDASVGLGTHLREITLAFDGEIDRDSPQPEGIWLESPGGHAVAATLDLAPCQQLAPQHAGVDCARLAFEERLQPEASYTLRVGLGVRDRHGAPLGPFEAQLQTARGPDREPPRPSAPSCAIDELQLEAACALVDDDSVTLRLLTDEPTIASLRGAGEEHFAIAQGGQLELRLEGLGSQRQLALELELRDASGNVRALELSLATTEPLATLSIEEVLFDPLGPEPAQELVELLNYGSAPLDLRGFSLGDKHDAEAAPIERELVIPPGARVLLVAEGFDPDEGSDMPPPPGALLLRHGRSLGSSGLSNAGEPLFLRDPAGRRISAAPATPKPRAGICRVRTTTDRRSGADGSFTHAEARGCTPGEP